MWISRQTWSTHLDRVARLEAQLLEQSRQLADMRVDVAKLDPIALEQLREKVLNSIRSYRRLAAAADTPDEEVPNDPAQLDIQPTWARGRRG